MSKMAKCNKCYAEWDWTKKDMYIDTDGHDLTVNICCPYCGDEKRAYSPNELAEQIAVNHVNYVIKNPPKYSYGWE